MASFIGARGNYISLIGLGWLTLALSRGGVLEIEPSLDQLSLILKGPPLAAADPIRPLSIQRSLFAPYLLH